MDLPHDDRRSSADRAYAMRDLSTFEREVRDGKRKAPHERGQGEYGEEEPGIAQKNDYGRDVGTREIPSVVSDAFWTL